MPYIFEVQTFYYNTWISDFDPETRVGYILKEYSNQDLLLSMTKC